MKVTQVVASAAGAVTAAVIASFFGVGGTLIGVVVGSVVFTTASGLVTKSLERTSPMVRRAVDQRPLRRRADGAPTARRVDGAGTQDATRPPSAPVLPPGRPRPPSSRRRTARRWVFTGVAAAAAGLAVVTAIEVVAGKPMASLLGASGDSSGTSAGNFVGGTSSSTTSTTAPGTTTTTTTTTVPASTTTTTVPVSTPTTAPAATSTTGAPSTTTTSVPSTTTTAGSAATAP